MDFVYLALTVGFFAATIGLVYFFETLRRPQ
jgi:hypothetical protein